MIHRSVIIGLAALALALPAGASVIFVDSNARGDDDGSSWENAYNNLQDALDAAQPGFEIWVANGSYVPERDREGTPTTGPEATFVLKFPGVKILGGFLGFEVYATQRDPLGHPTVIEGEGQKWHLVFVDDKFDVDTSTRFDGFLLRGGYADAERREDRFGGGMIVTNAGLTVANCTFVNNFATLGGAGLYHEGPAMNLVNCKFINNTGGENAAGGGLFAIGPMSIANCVFLGNTLGEGGFGGGAALLCGGGGLCVEPTATVATSTFAGNRINGEVGIGGGLYATPHVRLVNSILWGNQAPTNRSLGYAFFGPQVTFSDVQDGFPARGNLNLDPQFVDLPGGNVHLARTSPCVDVGSRAGLPLDVADLDYDGDTEETLPLDLDLSPREVGSLNLGGYESFDCNANGLGDYNEIAGCYGDPACGDCNGNGVPDGCDASLTRIYVNPAALGTRTGESWANAYQELRDAMCAVAVPGSQVREIWVRRGIYTPAAFGAKGGDQSAAFTLRNNLTIYGGFAGYETQLSQRNIVTNRVVLTGDLAFDDVPPFANREDNSQHVVIAENVDSTAVLDGIAITNGYAINARIGVPLGGGMIVINASPTIRDVVFLGNFADVFGGGLAVLGSSHVRISNAFFARNASSGSAIAALGGGRVTVSNSIFRENGVISPDPTVNVNSGSLVTLESCTFTQNLGRSGSVFKGAALRARNSIFWHNGAPEFLADGSGTAVVDVRYCDVQGGFNGPGNIDADPLFVSADGPDGDPGSNDDDLRLRAGSPCIDAGDPISPPLDEFDVDGAPRIGQCRTDMGVYESPLFADCDANGSGDACEISGNSSLDCDGDFRLDRCQPAFADCDQDGVNDACETDSDGDGVIDACDACPNDSAKAAPGACGCGVIDADSDGDGIADCIDNCPAKANADQIDGNANGAGDACDSLLHLTGCPGDLQVASSDPTGTTISFDLPQPLDAYGLVTLSSSAQPGSFFAIGDTTVTISASDEGGGFASCSFLITVLAPEEPNRPSPDPNDAECPPLYRANRGALRFFGIPIGCGPGCLAAVPFTCLGILSFKRRRHR